MLAQIIIGLIILVVISAAAFGLYASLHSSATSNNAQQYVMNLRGKVEQMFASNPNFTGFNTKEAVHAGLFSPAVGNTLSHDRVTAPAGFKVMLLPGSQSNWWKLSLIDISQNQCGTLAATFTGPDVVRIQPNGNKISNPAYGSGSGTSTWPPSTANVSGRCRAGINNNIWWEFSD